MIRFDNWILTADGEVIARQFDNLTRILTISGDIPAGWEWAVLVQVGNTQITDSASLEAALSGAAVGSTVQVTIYRSGRYYQVNLELIEAKG